MSFNNIARSHLPSGLHFKVSSLKYIRSTFMKLNHIKMCSTASVQFLFNYIVLPPFLMLADFICM